MEDTKRLGENYRQLALKALQTSLSGLYQEAYKLVYYELSTGNYLPPPSMALSRGITWPLLHEGRACWFECRVGRAGFVRVDEAADVIFERCMLEPELLVQSINAIEEATRWCYKAMEEIADAKRGHV